MVKKVEKLSKEYLGEKLKSLVEQQTKVERILEQYNELWVKLSGAIEVTKEMLEEFVEKEEVKDAG